MTRLRRCLSRTAGPPALLAVILLLMLPHQATALQPAFIKGTVYSAYDNAVLYNAQIATTSGISAKTSSGSFSFRVPPNVYNLIISAPGYTANMLSGILASPGQTSVVDIWLIPSSTTTGFLEGRILDAASFQPIKSAFIAVDLGGAAVSDDDGYFSMTVPSGTATVTAAATSHASKIIQQLFLRPARTERIIIYLRGKRSRDVTLTGLVKNACSGARLTGAQILSLSGDFDLASNGTYSLEIESGPSTVIATAQGYQYAYRSGSFPGYFFPSILNINLLPSKKSVGLVRGSVTNALSGEPLEGSRIVSDTGAISYSEADGSFELYTSACTASLSVSQPGFTQQQVPLAVTAGASTKLDIALEPDEAAPLVSGAAEEF